MVDVGDTEPLNSFLSDHKSFLNRLRETGRPIVLTIQDKPRLVVQDAAAYERLIDLINELDARCRQQKSVEPPDADEPTDPGEHNVPGVPPDRVLANMRKQLKRTTQK